MTCRTPLTVYHARTHTRLKEQKEDGVVWTPSKMIHRLGKEINHPDSVYVILSETLV